MILIRRNTSRRARECNRDRRRPSEAGSGTDQLSAKLRSSLSPRLPLFLSRTPTKSPINSPSLHVGRWVSGWEPWTGSVTSPRKWWLKSLKYRSGTLIWFLFLFLFVRIAYLKILLLKNKIKECSHFFSEKCLFLFWKKKQLKII